MSTVDLRCAGVRFQHPRQHDLYMAMMMPFANVVIMGPSGLTKHELEHAGDIVALLAGLAARAEPATMEDWSNIASKALQAAAGM